jgi:hypothetical protein
MSTVALVKLVSAERWRNWARTEPTFVGRVHRPSSTAELVEVVRSARRRLTLVGSGHSCCALRPSDSDEETYQPDDLVGATRHTSTSRRSALTRRSTSRSASCALGAKVGRDARRITSLPATAVLSANPGPRPRQPSERSDACVFRLRS